jgi:5-formyltetrahydrofolate cyclo-ligase
MGMCCPSQQIGLVARKSSADLKSAVSQNCILQIANCPAAFESASACRLKIGDTADYKSALRSTRDLEQHAFTSEAGTMLTSGCDSLHFNLQMPTPIQETKLALRREIRQRLIKLPGSKRVADSVRAQALLARQEIWNGARLALFYAPMAEELDLWPLVKDWLAAGKTAALPRYDAAKKIYVAARIENLVRDIRTGAFGIREPHEHCAVIPFDQLDLVLVPGTAFDLRGHRLGRGKGHYDQLLPHVRGRTCGVAFDEQIVAEVPIEPHDVRLNYILTPTRWVEV